MLKRVRKSAVPRPRKGPASPSWPPSTTAGTWTACWMARCGCCVRRGRGRGTGFRARSRFRWPAECVAPKAGPWSAILAWGVIIRGRDRACGPGRGIAVTNALMEMSRAPSNPGGPRGAAGGESRPRRTCAAWTPAQPGGGGGGNGVGDGPPAGRSGARRDGGRVRETIEWGDSRRSPSTS
jgi:hypothetical protein